MKALILKYWRRLRFTERDAERRLRGECIGVARSFDPKNVGDLLRGSQLIFEWLTDGKLPPDTEASA